MNRRTMLIASSVALAPAMAFAQQPRASAPLMQWQAQARLLSLAQTLQMMSNIANMLYDAAMSVIRKLGG